MEMVMEALDELPENQKEAFLLHEVEGIPLQEIADAADVPLKTVISRKRYAVLHLRNRLSDFYSEMNS
jgi:RNA polymerase sigma factor (sigma-70 family)